MIFKWYLVSTRGLGVYATANDEMIWAEHLKLASGAGILPTNFQIEGL